MSRTQPSGPVGFRTNLMSTQANLNNALYQSNKIRRAVASDLTVEYYDTISAAFAASVPGDTVIVGAGPYAEGSISVPTGVNFSAPEGTLITGDGTGSTVTLNGSTDMHGDFTLIAPNVAGVAGLVVSGTSNRILSTTTVSGAGGDATCISFASGAYGPTLVGQTMLVTGQFNTGYLVDEGHIVRGTIWAMAGAAVSGSVGIDLKGDLRLSQARFGLLDTATVDEGIRVSNVDAKGVILGGLIDKFQTAGARFTVAGGDLELNRVELETNAAEGETAVLIDEGLGDLSALRLHIEFGTTNREDWQVPDGFFSQADVHVIANSDEAGLENRLVSWGELSVGLPEKGYESVFGEGDSYSRGMLVYTSSSSGFVDVSAEARSTSSGTFSLPGLDNTNAIYVASSLYNTNDNLKFPGVRFVQTVQAVTGSGRIIAEYQTGSSWAKVNTMCVDNQDEFVSFPDQALFAYDDITTGSNHCYFDFRLPSSRVDWTKSDPMSLGTDYYWMRFIPSGTITTAPTFSNFRLHTNRTEINQDGFQQMFGYARTVRRLPWDSGAIQGAAASPGNQDIYFSDTITVGRIENEFAGNSTQRIGTCIPIPLDLDTSSPISFQIMWFGEAGASPGDTVQWNIRYDRSRKGDAIYSSAATAPTSTATQKVNTVVHTLSAANEVQITTIRLDVSEWSPRRPEGGSEADWMWLVIEREGASDTMSENAVLVNIRASYFAWSNGGHVVI